MFGFLTIVWIYRKDVAMHISKMFGLEIRGHRDIDFVDIDEKNDVGLYIDPMLVGAVNDEFGIKAWKCILTFFDEVARACRENNQVRLYQLLSHAEEPNETNLGMKQKSDYGKGSNGEKLKEILLKFYANCEYVVDGKSLLVNQSLLMKHFDKDKMSDLITNIIRKCLYEYTIKQQFKHKINVESLSGKSQFLGYYWDPEELNWEKLYGYPLRISDKKTVMLVPKNIVRRKYLLDVEKFISKFIFDELQAKHISEKSDLCTVYEDKKGNKKIKPPTKEILRKKELTDKNHKEYAERYIANNPESQKRFFDDVLRSLNVEKYILSDSKLDSIVYKQEKDNRSA